MDELKRNGSGYFDPTAYKAMKNIERGAEMEIYRGDIFFIEDKFATEGSEQRPGRPALVVSNNSANHFSNNVSIVWLTSSEKKPLPTHCEVVARIPSIALCEQVTTVSKARLAEYIKTATGAEMKAVDACLLVALGLGRTPDPTATVENGLVDELKTKLDKLNSENARLSLENSHMKEELKSQPIFAPDPEEIVRLKTQVELLEIQNERLLDRLIG